MVGRSGGGSCVGVGVEAFYIELSLSEKDESCFFLVELRKVLVALLGGSYRFIVIEGFLEGTGPCLFNFLFGNKLLGVRVYLIKTLSVFWENIRLVDIISLD